MYVIKESDFLSDYKRLVSYIYTYNKGQKDKNVGFAKVEIRNGQCKIYISLKGVYTDTPESYGIYFIVRKDGDINGVKLGNIIVKNGLGEYGDVTFPGNINNSGYSFAEIGGIFIGNKSDRHNVLASQWDDEEIITSKIVFPEEVSAKKSKENAKFVENESQETAQMENESEGIDEVVDLTDEQREKEHIKILAFPETKNEKTDELEDAKIAELKYSEDSEDLEDEIEHTEYEEEKFEAEDLESKSDWTTIFSQNNMIDAFADDDYYDCVEITPEDLKKLPLSDTNILTNSFLMHGYYGYKHILFGKVQRNGEKNLYFIGIPGVYSNREKFMSSMFGFNNFKKSHRSDSRNPYFGYWYMEIYI